MYLLGHNYVIHDTFLRYDSDNPLAEGDVGMAGVAVDSVEDMKVCVCLSVCRRQGQGYSFSLSVVSLLASFPGFPIFNLACFVPLVGRPGNEASKTSYRLFLYVSILPAHLQFDARIN